MPRIHLLLRLLFLLVLLPAQVALASVTAGAIKGTTLDDSGLPIPGVLVTITSDAMMGPRQSQTDVEGRFQFVELPPGVYELTAEAPGFAKVRQPGLQVNIGRNTQITVEMPLEDRGAHGVVQMLGLPQRLLGPAISMGANERIPGVLQGSAPSDQMAIGGLALRGLVKGAHDAVQLAAGRARGCASSGWTRGVEKRCLIQHIQLTDTDHVPNSGAAVVVGYRDGLALPPRGFEAFG